jgi:hypothetical protein
MSRHFSVLRSLVLAAALALAWAVLPAAAQQEPVQPEVPAEVSVVPWQDVITSQIQAFRDHDAPAAFSYAGAGFQTSFPSAEAFFAAIVTSGYAPIMESTTHSFGRYELLGEEQGVVQEVRFIGKDQDYYDAVYQLTEEAAGWRVQGVQLVKRPGIAI